MPDVNQSKKEMEDKEFREALNFLNIDKAELDDKALVTYKAQKDITDKVTSLKNIVLEYQMNLEGKTYDAEKGGYVQTGKALVGQEFIKLSAGILNNFAEPSNLLTTKKKETFIMQFKDAHEKVNLSLSMRNRAVPERTHRAVLKMWKDAFWNTSEIIIGADGNMERVFGKVHELENQEGMGKPF